MTRPLIDPPVQFGKFKAQNLRLSDLPKDYVSWLAHGTKDGGPIFHRGYNWDRLARLELERRLKGSAPGVPYEDDPRDTMLVGMESDVQLTPADVDIPSDRVGDAVPGQPSRTYPPIMTVEALDAAARFFLKEFITRRNKEQSLSEFVGDLAREAATNGHRLSLDYLRDPEYEYTGKTFHFAWDDSVRNFKLRAITQAD